MSFIITIILSVIPEVGIRIDGKHYFFGFPAQWLGYYAKGQYSFELLGLLFNFFIIYLLILFLNKLSTKLSNKKKTNHLPKGK